jgi:uncharacterized lipoprotein YmbA
MGGGVAAARAPGMMVAIAVSLMAGCTFTSAPTRFYVLTPAGASAPAPEPSRGVTIGVGPVTLPGYLDRPQIVTRPGPGEVQVADFDHWAEPLRSAVARTIGENLAALIPTHRVLIFPWRRSGPPGYQVIAEILRLDGTLGGDAVLRARWRVLDGSGRELAARTSELREPAGTGYTSLVAAESRLLEQLSVEIAAVIIGAPR